MQQSIKALIELCSMLLLAKLIPNKVFNFHIILEKLLVIDKYHNTIDIKLKNYV